MATKRVLEPLITWGTVGTLVDRLVLCCPSCICLLNTLYIPYHVLCAGMHCMICLQTIHIGVLGQEVMNNVLLVVMDRILTQTQVTANVVEGVQYNLDLRTLLRSDATSQRYPSSELPIIVHLM